MIIIVLLSLFGLLHGAKMMPSPSEQAASLLEDAVKKLRDKLISDQRISRLEFQRTLAALQSNPLNSTVTTQHITNLKALAKPGAMHSIQHVIDFFMRNQKDIPAKQRFSILFRLAFTHTNTDSDLFCENLDRFPNTQTLTFLKSLGSTFAKQVIILERAHSARQTRSPLRHRLIKHAIQDLKATQESLKGQIDSLLAKDDPRLQKKLAFLQNLQAPSVQKFITSADLAQTFDLNKDVHHACDFILQQKYDFEDSEYPGHPMFTPLKFKTVINAFWEQYFTARMSSSMTLDPLLTKLFSFCSEKIITAALITKFKQAKQAIELAPTLTKEAVYNFCGLLYTLAMIDEKAAFFSTAEVRKSFSKNEPTMIAPLTVAVQLAKIKMSFYDDLQAHPIAKELLENPCSLRGYPNDPPAV